MRIRSCCCCLTLRQGTYVSVTYAMIVSGIGIAMYGYLLHVLNQHQNLIEELYERRGLENESRKGFDLATILVWVSLAIMMLWFISALMVICATRSKIRWMVLPFIVITTLLNCLYLYQCITKLVHIGDIISSAQTLFQYILEVVILLINFYVLLCVGSFYKFHLQNPEEVENINPEVGMGMLPSGGGTAAPPPGYNYNYQPAPQAPPVGDPMQQKGYPQQDYRAPVYQHDNMTQKI